MTFRNILFLLAGFSLVLVVSGCPKGIELTEGGKKVHILESVPDKEACKLEGMLKITVSREDPLGVTPEEIVRDIQTYAKNNAADVGGNVAVPTSEVENNIQTFDAYSCPDELLPEVMAEPMEPATS